MWLVDSSAWILLGADLESLKTRLDGVATCPPIVQEMLQGASGSAAYQQWRNALLRTRVLDAPVPLTRYEEAARLYLRCRDAGFTIRSSVDCLIAACAIAHDITVLHDDRDFQFIAQVTQLKAQRV